MRLCNVEEVPPYRAIRMLRVSVLTRGSVPVASEQRKPSHTASALNVGGRGTVFDEQQAGFVYAD